MCLVFTSVLFIWDHTEVIFQSFSVCGAALQLLENGLYIKQFVFILIHIILIGLLTLRFSF